MIILTDGLLLCLCICESGAPSWSSAAVESPTLCTKRLSALPFSRRYQRRAASFVQSQMLRWVFQYKSSHRHGLTLGRSLCSIPETRLAHATDPTGHECHGLLSRAVGSLACASIAAISVRKSGRQRAVRNEALELCCCLKCKLFAQCAHLL